MRTFSHARRAGGQRVALVPTMGALHKGHAALISEAARQAPTVVVSIFVNPMQFGPNEDFDRYPRPFDADVALLQTLPVDAVFYPSVEEMYPDGLGRTIVRVEELSTVLEGQWRPQHFQGVSTVVAKLLHIVDPDVAVFGQKDWQQLAIVKQMVRDLHFGVEVIGVPTVREANGLALSSRNRYLSPAQRQQAAAIFQSLQQARTLYQDGERDRATIRQSVTDFLIAAHLPPQYVELVDPDTLVPKEDHLDGPAVILVAVRLGTTRLIDNIRLDPSTNPA